MADQVWVVGGDSGIGKEIVLEAQSCGYEAVGTGEADCDVRRPIEVLRTFEAIKPTHIVYSAGINDLRWIPDISNDAFLDLLHVNVVGFATLLSILVGNPYANDAYSLVAISSDAAVRPMRTSLMYCASKAALDQAVRVAAREMGPFGWRVNAVAPGKVADTGMTEYVDRTVPALRGWTEEYAAEYERASSPLGRPVTKSEVAKVVLSVLFGAVALNGAIIPVNGGR